MYPSLAGAQYAGLSEVSVGIPERRRKSVRCGDIVLVVKTQVASSPS